MSEDTQDLSELSFRDIKDLAKELGLSARGSKAKLIASIEEARAAEEEPEPVAEVEEAAAEEEPAEAAPPEKEEPAEAKEVELTPRALDMARRTIAGYITVESYTRAVADKVEKALKAGKQPCIVEGSGNARFELKIFDKVFDRSDLSSDVPTKVDGVIHNVARRLADVNLYPHS